MLTKRLSYDRLIVTVRRHLSRVSDHRRGNPTIALVDILMSVLAMFSLKDSSLLQFVNSYAARRANLQNVFGLLKLPSDTAIRQVLDHVLPSKLVVIYSILHAKLRDLGILDSYIYLGNYLLAPIDGTQYFSSKKVKCDYCLTKNHRDGTTTYCHQCLTSVIVHPDHREVFVLGTEDIVNSDGSTKNDCELSASKRLLKKIVNPLKDRGIQLIHIGDALYANGPFIKEVQQRNDAFILVVKPGSQATLVHQFDRLNKANKTKKKQKKERQLIHQYEYINGLFLNGEHPDILVNMVDYKCISQETGKVIKHFTFITDIKLTTKTVDKIVKAGRARWKIENETFNTLKNQGYNYQHNYGHGHKHLAVNMSILMFLAFLIDQIAMRCDKNYRWAMSVKKAKKVFYEKVRHYFDEISVPDMNTIYLIITKQIRLTIKMNV